MTEQLRVLESFKGKISTVLPHTIQGLGIVRYSAYDGVGGDQSFSLTLLDELGNGAIITCLHSGADIRVYGKPVQVFRSSYSLSADEQESLGLAKQNMTNELTNAKATTE